VALSTDLQTRRIELSISQAELAGQLGVSQQTVSRWESGAISPGPRRLAELAQALRLDASGLLRAAGYLVASDLVVDWLRPTAAELGAMTTNDLVRLIDAGWQQLRHRLDASPTD
jgi:transcriptional regulator with XRE-family HTH domain